MIIYNIKTWGCSDANCNYTQDFEPTQELMDQYFNASNSFGLSDIQGNECPSCAGKGNRGVSMIKETNPKKKHKFRHIEQAEVDALRTERESEPTRKVPTGGKEKRVETDDEKALRAENEAGRGKRTKEEKDQIKAELMAQPNIEREFPVLRDETPTEKTVRINNEVARYTVLEAQQIQALRDQYED